MSPRLSTALRELAGTAAQVIAGGVGARFERERLPPDDHRPWPVPRASWVMRQTWEDLAFLHWPLPRAALDGLLPPPLRADVFDGSAWLGITPFRLSRARGRGVPAVPWLSSFHEVNVRTYVTLDDRPGVVFFSLDAGSRLAVAGARAWYALPYFFATGGVTARGGWTHVTSRRAHPAAPPARLVASYRPIAPVARAPAGSLEAWLTERYGLYAVTGDGQVWRADIHHVPWPLQRAEVRIEDNTLAGASGLAVSGPPALVHYSRSLEASIWPPRRLSRPAARTPAPGGAAGVETASRRRRRA